MAGWKLDLPPTLYFDYDRVQKDPYGFEAFAKEMAAQPALSLDTETTGLVSWKDVPLYWSTAWDGKRATLHANILHHFQPIFRDPRKSWVMANAKYDAHIVANVGCGLAGKFVDVQVMHSLLHEDKPHDLKFIAKHVLGWTWADFQDTFGKINKQQSPEQLIRKAEKENMNLLIEYAANDAHGTWGSFKQLRYELQLANTHSLFRQIPPYIETLWDLFSKIEVPYTKVLWKMERRGIKVNRQVLETAEPEARKEIEAIEKEIAKQVGYVMNPGSNKQLQEYFFEKQGLQPFRWTKGGKSGVRKPSVDAIVMQKFAEDGDPVAKLCMKHSELSKLHGTYIVGLHELLDPKDRIHTRFNQDVARTGRLSSSGPNLQNIPKPENDKWSLRKAFITDPGKSIIAADYEQLEMRLLAAAALEKDMIEIFKKNWDIHMGNASLMYNLPYDDLEGAKKIEKKIKNGDLPESAMTDYVRKCLDARAAAKNIGFGLNYGMGANRLARQLGCTKEEAEEKIERYKKTYPAVSQFYQEAVRETELTGYAFTILGRRRNVPEIMSHQRSERALGERVAINTQIQGSAADVCKMAQINLDKVGIAERYGCDMLLQVHDELVFECPDETLPDALIEIRDLMEHPFPDDLTVHLAIDHGHGPSWGHAK